VFHGVGMYRLRMGSIILALQVEEDKVKLQITTPAETRLTLPDGTVHMLEAGSYEYCQKYL
ncbi:MAG: hypothetical protein K2K19_06495, partial [Acetatifactor sp.]|nr:hypothetical protein [Acetatifactor sp.]